MSYTIVDSFNRANTGANGLGSPWIDVAGVFEIKDNTATRVPGQNGNSVTGSQSVFRPTSESFADGKVRVLVPNYADNGAPLLHARWTAFTKNVGCYCFPGNGTNFATNQAELSFIVNGGAGITGDGNTHLGADGTNHYAVPNLTYPYYLELDCEGSVLVASVYAADGTTLGGRTTLHLDTDASAAYQAATASGNAAPLGSGQWGFGAYSRQDPAYGYAYPEIDQVEIYSNTAATALALSTPNGAVGVAQNVVVSANGALSAPLVVTLAATDGILATTSVTLTPSTPNASVAFTPSATGFASITAAASGLTGATASFPVYDAPCVFGVIGDSISDPTLNNSYVPSVVATLETAGGASRDVVVVNRGASGRTSRSWLPDGSPGAEAGLLAGAVAAFNAAKVTVITQMVGTNDSKVSEDIDKPSFKANCQTIAQYCFANVPTLQRYVFQFPPTPISTYTYDGTPGADFSSTDGIHGYHRVEQYHDAIAEIVAADTAGRYVSGNKGAYLRLTQKPTLLTDGIHPGANSEAGFALAGADSVGVLKAFGFGSSGAVPVAVGL